MAGYITDSQFITIMSHGRLHQRPPVHCMSHGRLHQRPFVHSNTQTWWMVMTSIWKIH